MPKRTIAKPYARRGPVREPYDTVLIVCEGTKTEPNYFSAIRTDYRLSSANIAVVSPPGTDPMSIVAYAESRLPDYDRVYCVFDRNGHQNFTQAVAKVAASVAARTGRWHAITSTPCFEIWVLLHFRYTTSAFAAAGGRSACDNVVVQVRHHLPNYAKGDPTIYEQIKDRTDAAIANAQRLAAHNTATESVNPGTLVHDLVDYLRKLRPD
jgi:hypothetical protein